MPKCHEPHSDELPISEVPVQLIETEDNYSQMDSVSDPDFIPQN